MDYGITEVSYDQRKWMVGQFQEIAEGLGVDPGGVRTICERTLFLSGGPGNESVANEADWAFLSTVDLVLNKLIQLRDHPQLHEIRGHLTLLCDMDVPMGVYAATPRRHSFFLELICALCALGVSSRVEVASATEASKVTNADVIFEYEKKAWALECKTMYGENPSTLRDRLLEAKRQLGNAHWRCEQPVDFGMAVIGLMNVYAKESGSIRYVDEISSESLREMSQELASFGQERFQQLDTDLRQLRAEIQSPAPARAVFAPIILQYQHTMCRCRSSNLPMFVRTFMGAKLGADLPGFEKSDAVVEALNTFLQPQVVGG